MKAICVNLLFLTEEMPRYSGDLRTSADQWLSWRTNTRNRRLKVSQIKAKKTPGASGTWRAVKMKRLLDI